MNSKNRILLIVICLFVFCAFVGTVSAKTSYVDDSGGVVVTEEIVLTTITVEPATATMTVGETQVFRATAYDQYGCSMPGVAITWTSTETTVGTVSPTYAITGADGTATTTFTALACKTTNVMASNGTVVAWATVNVVCCPPTVTITTDAITYSPGDTMIVTLDIASGDPVTPVTFEWYIGVPQLDVWVTYASSPIPAGFANSYTIPIPVGDWGPTPFGLVHYVHMLNPVSGDVLVQDVALCAYSPCVGEAMSIEVEEEIMKTIERVELPN